MFSFFFYINNFFINIHFRYTTWYFIICITQSNHLQKSICHSSPHSSTPSPFCLPPKPLGTRSLKSWYWPWPWFLRKFSGKMFPLVLLASGGSRCSLARGITTPNLCLHDQLSPLLPPQNSIYFSLTSTHLIVFKAHPDNLWRRQWHPTPVLLPGKSHGWRSLVGCSPWGC